MPATRRLRASVTGRGAPTLCQEGNRTQPLLFRTLLDYHANRTPCLMNALTFVMLGAPGGDTQVLRVGAPCSASG